MGIKFSTDLIPPSRGLDSAKKEKTFRLILPLRQFRVLSFFLGKLVNLSLSANQKIGSFEERIHQYEKNDVQLREELSLTEASLNEADQLNRELEFKLTNAQQRLEQALEESTPAMSENIEMAAKLKVLHNSLEEMTKRLQV